MASTSDRLFVRIPRVFRFLQPPIQVLWQGDSGISRRGFWPQVNHWASDLVYLFASLGSALSFCFDFDSLRSVFHNTRGLPSHPAVVFLSFFYNFVLMEHAILGETGLDNRANRQVAFTPLASGWREGHRWPADNTESRPLQRLIS